MSKTVNSLTPEEMEVLEQYVDLLGVDEEEALKQAISDKAISDNTGGGVGFKPEGFEEIKFNGGNPKANMVLANRAYKKANKKDFFEMDHYYYNPKHPKGDDGKFIVDEISGEDLGEEVEFIITKVAYRASRATFGKSGPEKTNFETTYADDMFPTSQQNMIIKGGGLDGQNIWDYGKQLKSKYHDGINGKTQAKVPDNLKYKFKVVIFGLAKVDGEWKKAFFEGTNRYEDEYNLVADFLNDAKGIKLMWVNELKIDGADGQNNPIQKVIPQKALAKKEWTEMKQEIMDNSRAVQKFIDDQREASKQAPDSASSKEHGSDDDEDELGEDFWDKED